MRPTAAGSSDYPLLRLLWDCRFFLKSSAVCVVVLRERDVLFAGPFESRFAPGTKPNEFLLTDINLLEAKESAITGCNRRLYDSLERRLLDNVQVAIGR